MINVKFETINYCINLYKQFFLMNRGELVSLNLFNAETPKIYVIYRILSLSNMNC